MAASDSNKRLDKILNQLSPCPSTIESNETAAVTDELMKEILAHRKSKEGQTMGESKWYHLNQEQLDIFSDLTHDHNWIHKAGAGEKGSPYGAPIAHGLLTLSHLPKFMYEVMGKQKDIYKYAQYVKTSINYGYDKVRFVGPVKAGNSIRARVVLKEVSMANKPKMIKSVCLVTIETKDQCSGKVSNAVIIESITLTVYR